MEIFEFNGHTFQIFIEESGRRFDWWYVDGDGATHRNLDSPLTTRDLALTEAQYSIRNRYRS